MAAGISELTKENTLLKSSLNISTNGAVLDVLKCSFCEKFLTVKPIYCHGLELICGRCNFTNREEESNWTRQTLYESIAQFLTFPCSNSLYGCKAQLKWADVETHENTCQFKKLKCPFANDHLFSIDRCTWTGASPGLNDHLECQHADLINKLPEFDFSKITTNLFFLTRMAKELMLVVIKFFPPGKFSCLVMMNGISGDCDAYRYQLELYDESRKNSVFLRKSHLEDAIAFEENLINDDKMLVFDLSAIKALLKSPSVVIGRLGVMKKSKKEMCYGMKNINMSQKESLTNENFLRELECPVCKNYLVAPIEMCMTGHSFCSKCKRQMEECPTCRHPFEDGRNYTLEKVIALINYPCIYKDAGCSANYSSEKIREHESQCNFAGSQCILNCSRGTIVNMFQHLHETHEDTLVISGDTQMLELDPLDLGLTKFYAICFGNDIFRLAVKYDDELTFSLQQFGVKKSNYSYELEILCKNERTIFEKECRPLSHKLLENCIKLPENIVERYATADELIFFKVHLKKAA